MFDNLLRLLLNDSLQPGLAKTEIFQMFESKPPLLLPQLAVRGDDSLQRLLAVILVLVGEICSTLLIPLSDLKYLDIIP